MKRLWLIAGGNGAGKTTFYHQFLAAKGMPFINADDIARELYPGSEEANSLNAAKLAESIRLSKLKQGASFCFETVFSHTSKVDFVAHAKACGYRIHFIFIHVELADINAVRVLQRVEEGGHSVPLDKIYSRIPRALNNAHLVQPLCNTFWVFDNSFVDAPYKKIFVESNGCIQFCAEPLPSWAKAFKANR